MPKRGVAFVTKNSFGKTKKAKLSKGVSAATLQAAVKKAIMKVAEIKEYSTSSAPAALTTAGAVAPLNQIAEGTEINQRVGRHLTPKGIDVCVSIAGAAVTTLDFIYIALVWDKQPDGTTPSYATIMDTASTTNAWQAFKNTLQYRDRFTILWEERSVLENDTAVASTPNNFENNFYRKYIDLSKKNLKCEYIGSGAGTPATGGLYIIYIDSAAAAQMGYTCKFTYTDF